MEEIGNNLGTKENFDLKCNWYENMENMPQNEQNIKFHDHVEPASDEFDFGEQLNINDDEATNTNINRYDLQDTDTSRTCIGEPLAPQIIIIDFTPVDGLDDVEPLQEKCLGFWKFVNENPNLQHLSDKGLEEVHSFIIDSNTNNPTNRSDSYNSVNQTIHVLKNVVRKQTLPEPTSEMGLLNRLSRSSNRVPDEINKLCHEMKNWDILHPKSMKPPETVKFDP